MLVHCWWDFELVQPLEKMVWWFLKKWKLELPYDSTILLLAIYLKEMKPLSWRGICTPISITALFTLSKPWKWPKYPATNKWMKKHTHAHTHWKISHKKEGNVIFCKYMDGHWRHYAKWKKQTNAIGSLQCGI